MHLFFSSCGLALSSPILIFLECFSWAHLIHVALESCISSVVNNPSLLVFCVMQLLINWSNHDVILIAFRTLNLQITNGNLSFWIAAADDTSSIIALSFSDSGERSLVISSGHSSCYVDQNGQLSQLSVKFSAKNHILPRYEKIYVGCTFSQVIGPSIRAHLINTSGLKGGCVGTFFVIFRIFVSSLLWNNYFNSL